MLGIVRRMQVGLGIFQKASLFLPITIGFLFVCSPQTSFAEGNCVDYKFSELDRMNETGVFDKLDEIYKKIQTEYKTLKTAEPELKRLSQCTIEKIFRDLGSLESARFEFNNSTLGMLRFISSLPNAWKGEEVLVKSFGNYATQARRKNSSNLELLEGIDNALANAPGQLKSIIRGETTAESKDPTQDKYDQFNSIIGSGAYRGGPLEVSTYDLGAIAAEGLAVKIMLPPQNDETNAGKLLAEEEFLLKQAIETLKSASTINSLESIRFLLNDFRFRLSVIRLALGLDNWPEELKTILVSSSTWGNASPLDHVYVHAFVRWPKEPVSVPGDIQRSNELLQLNPIRTFFNPGQIALHLCMLDLNEKNLLKRLITIDKHLNTFVNRDFRVFVKSSKSKNALKELKSDYNKQLSANKAKVEKVFAEAREKVRFAVATPEWSKSIPAAVNRCSLNSASVFKVFNDFKAEAKGTWETSGDAEGKTYGIFIGDFISKDEATELSKVLLRILNLETEPFIARPKIDG